MYLSFFFFFAHLENTKPFQNSLGSPRFCAASLGMQTVGCTKECMKVYKRTQAGNGALGTQRWLGVLFLKLPITDRQ